MPTAFSHLILDVRDVGRSLEFYTGLLGIVVTREDWLEGHRLAYLETGSTEILLIQQPEDPDTGSDSRCGGMLLKFAVDNLVELAEQVATKEIAILRGMESGPSGARSMLVADPDGYAVLLSQPGHTYLGATYPDLAPD